MKFENVQLLIDEMQDEISRMNYCWVDNQGLISKQNGVFRVNCIDCLDRTNVVQVKQKTVLFFSSLGNNLFTYFSLLLSFLLLVSTDLYRQRGDDVAAN